jgi:hypothetical protein
MLKTPLGEEVITLICTKETDFEKWKQWTKSLEEHLLLDTHSSHSSDVNTSKKHSKDIYSQQTNSHKKFVSPFDGTQYLSL